MKEIKYVEIDGKLYPDLKVSIIKKCIYQDLEE